MSRAEAALAGALLFAGLINALPVMGLLGGGRLAALYGMPFEDASLRILMRHRALLFGMLGGAMIAAAFLPGWRRPMACAGLASMLGFLLIAALEGGGNAAVRRVVLADLIACLALVPALAWAGRVPPQ